MGTFVEYREDLRQIIKSLQAHGKQVVFTNGVFDLLHVGHIRSLKDARSRGDYLVVALNSDKSVKQLKGTALPVNPLQERVELLCAIDCVNYVTVLEETTADELLEFLRPNIHAKGRDYTEETVPERETVLAYGGTIAIVGDPKKHSTTSILEKVGMIAAKKTKATVKKGKKPAAPKKKPKKSTTVTKKSTAVTKKSTAVTNKSTTVTNKSTTSAKKKAATKKKAPAKTKSKKKPVALKPRVAKKKTKSLKSKSAGQ